MIRGCAKVFSRRGGALRASVPRSVRSFSTIEKKGHGEEAKYFAQADAEKVRAMKAKFESVVAKGDSEDIEELMEVLGELSESVEEIVRN